MCEANWESLEEAIELTLRFHFSIEDVLQTESQSLSNNMDNNNNNILMHNLNT